VPNLDAAPLAGVSSPPFSANFAFSSSFALTAFYFSRSFYFLSSVAVFALAADAAVGLINLDGAFSPPAPPSDAPSLSLLTSCATAALASSAAFFSASLRAYLSIRVNLGFWGEITFASFETSTEEVDDLVEDTTLYLLAFSSSGVVLGLGSRAISFFSSTFSLSI
jgi:hypothetical protein